MGINRSRPSRVSNTNQQTQAMSSDESTDFDDGLGGGRVASVGGRASSSDEDTNDRSMFSAFLRNLISAGTVQLINDEDNVLDDDESEEHTNGNELVNNTNFESAGKDEIELLKTSDIGQEIALNSGQISSHSSISLDERLNLRQLGARIKCKASYKFSAADRGAICHNYLPNKRRIIDRHRTKTFCCQYSKSGDILMTASQDHIIRFYRRSGGKFVLFNQVEARDVGWAILDLDVSPDGRHVIYGTWSDNLHQFNVYGDELTFETYNLEAPDYRFCAFSVRFSDSGREIVAGASDGFLYVYDREAKKNLARIRAHKDDVNAVCFGDKSSNIIYSGGDDGLCKLYLKLWVWDRRTLRSEENPSPAGILAGHCDGVTFIDSRGDGRHLISNSKDQSIKLWDIRYLSSYSAVNATYQAVSNQQWDYRWQEVPKQVRKYRKLSGDSSLMTYRGHKVLHTLVRCYFSPLESTGQRYIYSGCANGGAVIYDVLTGEIVTRLPGHKSCVRDAAWHPYESEIVTSSWDGSTVVWTYDERRNRLVHPDSPSWEHIGYEDTSDEEGEKLSIAQIQDRQMKASTQQFASSQGLSSVGDDCRRRSARLQSRNDDSRLLASLFAAAQNANTDSS